MGSEGATSAAAIAEIVGAGDAGGGAAGGVDPAQLALGQLEPAQRRTIRRRPPATPSAPIVTAPAAYADRIEVGDQPRRPGSSTMRAIGASHNASARLAAA
ncbi:MAG: hypothetical protein IPH80_38525, partial [Myxococcales bacterium]|nr:hypothetical protein [Myxococcales bacterium]